MEVAVAVAQTSVTWDIGQNLAGITACLADAGRVRSWCCPKPACPATTTTCPAWTG